MRGVYNYRTGPKVPTNLIAAWQVNKKLAHSNGVLVCVWEVVKMQADFFSKTTKEMKAIHQKKKKQKKWKLNFNINQCACVCVSLYVSALRTEEGF